MYIILSSKVCVRGSHGVNTVAGSLVLADCHSVWGEDELWGVVVTQDGNSNRGPVSGFTLRSAKVIGSHRQLQIYNILQYQIII